jgi:hypothetical protein
MARLADSGRDPVADALLAEVRPAAPSIDGGRALTGSGFGRLPSDLGDAGSGGGSGGGKGKGSGPRTQFFGTEESAVSFVYLIDCSGSMTQHHALTVAKRELLSSLDQLPPDAQFSAIFYNDRPEVLLDSAGQLALMPATAANKERARQKLATIKADGATDHVKALRSALVLKPEVVFFLTDAEQYRADEVEPILKEVGSARIQAIQFGYGLDSGEGDPLRSLAHLTGGTYRHIDVSKFPGR